MSHQSPKHRPTVLCIAGFDPTGGAGISADFETIGSLGAHACGIISALTVQDSANLYRLETVDTGLIQQQFDSLIRDFDVQVIKIGLLGNTEIAEVVAGLLSTNATIPVVFDPVLTAGGGARVSTETLLETIRQQLLPLTTLLTPNSLEARQLSGKNTPDDCADRLQKLGAQNILITGTHEDSESVINRLYQPDGQQSELQWPRLESSYHGSGCTLSSAIAAKLALGQSLENAVSQAQLYTWNSLERAFAPGKHQLFPMRFGKNLP